MDGPESNYFYRIANGKIASTEHQPPFYSGAELEFKCNLGFRLMQSRKKVHSRLICHDSGHWQPPRNYRNPKCIRKQCARPRTIPYGRIISQVFFTIIKYNFWKNYLNIGFCNWIFILGFFWVIASYAELYE